jgi:UDP-N-acetylmuramoyl-tripeptide--D-alanyl-D-alanine ligase
MLTVADIFEGLSGYRPAWGGQKVNGAVIDSRLASSGCLFVALKGEQHDGHDYVKEAFKNGAHFAIVERDPGLDTPIIDLRAQNPVTGEYGLNPPLTFLVDESMSSLQQLARFWRSKLKMKTIGITGSVGKSTTKELAAEVLSQRFLTARNPGNMNNEIGLPLTILSLDESIERAVLEMGFYVAGEIDLLCSIAKPEIGVITNVGTVHAARAGSLADIARGKAELVRALPPAPEGVAILNYDDPLVKEMSVQTSARVFFYGLNPDADIWADHIESLGLDGMRFRLHSSNEVLHLRIPLIGRHSVHTALRAAAVGLVEGLTWEEIVRGLRSGQAQLRLVTTRGRCGALIIDDTYNASPDSTLAALNLLADLQGHKLAILGDMLELGQYENQGHEMVGIRAAQVVDVLITVGEKAHMIAASALSFGLRNDQVIEFDEAEEAIAYLQNKLEPGDVVLIKGSRAMRMDKIVTALEAHS